MRAIARTVAMARALAVVMAVGLALVIVCGSVNVALAQTSAAPIRLRVDAAQAPQKILHVHMEIPVAGGPVTLYYPEWSPGGHMPARPIIAGGGVKFSGGG